MILNRQIFFDFFFFLFSITICLRVFRITQQKKKKKKQKKFLKQNFFKKKKNFFYSNEIIIMSTQLVRFLCSHKNKIYNSCICEEQFLSCDSLRLSCRKKKKKKLFIFFIKKKAREKKKKKK
jgi:hypothetical protein